MIVRSGSSRFTKFHSSFAWRGLDYSSYGGGMLSDSFVIVSTSYGSIHSEEMEASSSAMRRKIRRFGKMYLSVLPVFSFTKKKAGVRMGKGKGKVVGYFSFVRPGSILFEVRFKEGIASNSILAALESGVSKFSMSTKVFSFSSVYG